MYHVNMKEMSILILHRGLHVFRILVCIVLCLGLKEIPVKVNGKGTGNFLLRHFLFFCRCFSYVVYLSLDLLLLCNHMSSFKVFKATNYC